MIPRKGYEAAITEALRRSPVVAMIGPRQRGKSTLATAIAARRRATFFDLERNADLVRLEAPERALEPLRGLVVLDEIQRAPQVLPVLRVLADRPGTPARFLLLGSASPLLIKNASESLAGRVEFVELGGFGLDEIGNEHLNKLWLRGSFPRAFLPPSQKGSWAWRENFIKTFLERDMPQLGITIPASAMRRFWMMLAHYHGQVWNASELARSMGLTDKTVRSYLDILTGTFMVRQLQPWFENVGKRQVKAPKVYLRDSGLLHTLMAIPNRHALLGHPKLGAS
jgi:predicted AAA+ superfamily ATPase